jgi:type IX secretion system PorP/SprF family membrane protein
MKTCKPFVLCVALIICFFHTTVLAQGFAFSNGFESPMYLNPSYAGTSGAPQLSTQFRRPTVGGGFFHYAAAFDMPVKKLRGGVGFVLSSTILESVLVETQLNGVYALHWQVNEEMLVSPAISIGFGYNHFNSDNLNFGGGAGVLNTSYLTLGGGVLMRYQNLLAGFSLDHLNNPDVGYAGVRESLPTRIVLHGIYDYAVRESVSLLPGIIYQSFWNINHISPSLTFDFLGFRAGIAGNFTRAGSKSQQPDTNGMSFLVGIRLKQLLLGYGYTTGLSGNMIPGVTAHEFAITYRFGDAAE